MIEFQGRWTNRPIVMFTTDAPLFQEHGDLLRRLRGWVEHYRLPSRMAPFKRGAFAIACPVESLGRTGTYVKSGHKGILKATSIKSQNSSWWECAGYPVTLIAQHQMHPVSWFSDAAL